MTDNENAKPDPNRGDSEYTSEDLLHLSDLEHVRERPSDVHWRHDGPRVAPPCIRSRR